MRIKKIDCKNPERDDYPNSEKCRWCGRLVKRSSAGALTGKIVHMRGQRRMHEDPRIRGRYAEAD